MLATKRGAARAKSCGQEEASHGHDRPTGRHPSPLFRRSHLSECRIHWLSANASYVIVVESPWLLVCPVTKFGAALAVKMETRGGKDVTVTGCVEKQSNGDYVLTPIRDTGRGPLERSWYALVASEDLSARVGERVEIKGRAAANDDVKISVESMTKTEIANGTDHGTETKATGTSGVLALPQLPHLRVRSMKTLSSCR